MCRSVEISVEDSFGDDAPTVTVTLRHVGPNDDRPNVMIARKTVTIRSSVVPRR